jgi:hypothetical protein
MPSDPMINSGTVISLGGSLMTVTTNGLGCGWDCCTITVYRSRLAPSRDATVATFFNESW